MGQTPGQAPVWLWVPAAPGVCDSPGLGEILRTYRGVHDLSQLELAEFLGFDQSYISRLESGQRRIRDVGHLRRIAQRLGMPAEELALAAGMLGQAPRDGSAQIGRVPADERSAAVGASQWRWRLVRQGLNRRRGELARVAASLYPDTDRLGRAPLLVRRDWVPTAPVELADVALAWVDAHPSATVTGTETESEHVRPLTAAGGRYERYSRAIRDLDRPTLFENRLSYRLLDVEWGPNSGRLTFGHTTYFDMIDVSEAAAHELAAVWLRQTADPVHPTWSELPFRRLIGDPLDLARRALLLSISVLTIRPHGASATFILHRRDPTRVAIGGGMFHVMPAVAFQPSTISAVAQANDFDLWRNILRGFSEEFLGNREHDGSGSSPIDYERAEPFRTLNQARREGRLPVWCFGIGLDPLQLTGDILTVAVIDDDVFDSAFAGFVETNSEGVAVAAGRHARAAEGIPFTEATVRRLLEAELMTPPGAACLDLAWWHRRLLLGG
ncbi:MAG: helix-turn-helix domain-containing protein [Egibacteraceae bacterium]